MPCATWPDRQSKGLGIGSPFDSSRIGTVSTSWAMLQTGLNSPHLRHIVAIELPLPRQPCKIVAVLIGLTISALRLVMSRITRLQGVVQSRHRSHALNMFIGSGQPSGAPFCWCLISNKQPAGSYLCNVFCCHHFVDMRVEFSGLPRIPQISLGVTFACLLDWHLLLLLGDGLFAHVAFWHS